MQIANEMKSDSLFNNNKNTVESKTYKKLIYGYVSEKTELVKCYKVTLNFIEIIQQIM